MPSRRPYARPVGNSVSAILAADITNASGSYGTVVAVAFAPRSTTVVIRTAGVYSNGSGAIKHAFQVSGDNSAGTKQIGSPICKGSGQQDTFSGIAVYTGLKPGTVYTFTVKVNPTSGSFLCRAAASSGDEIWAVTAEDGI